METIDLNKPPKAKPAVVPKQVQASGMVGKAQDQLSTRLKTQSPSATPETQNEKLPQSMLDKLWVKMTEIYGHRWTANFGVLADPDHSWASVLKGLTGVQIANGLNALVDKGEEFDWPPPANVFRAMCLQVAGMPSTKDAWLEALIGVYSHEAVKVAAEATSTFDLKSADQDDKALFQRFERNYLIVQRRAQRNLPLNGGIALGIGNDAARPRTQIQLEYSHKIADVLIEELGIPTDPKAARAALLAKVGIRRDKHA